MMECHTGFDHCSPHFHSGLPQAWQVNADGQKAEHNDSDHEWAKVRRAKE